MRNLSPCVGLPQASHEYPGGGSIKETDSPYQPLKERSAVQLWAIGVDGASV